MRLTPKQIVLQKIDPYIGDKYSPRGVADIAVEAIQKDYRIEPKGTPIKPEDVRKGDRVRIEWQDGDTSTFTTATRLPEGALATIYLLDRPDPDAGFVFPTRDGAVIRLTAKTGNAPRTIAIRETGLWRVAGAYGTRNEISVREHWQDFEVLSDGSDQ